MEIRSKRPLSRGNLTRSSFDTEPKAPKHVSAVPGRASESLICNTHATQSLSASVDIASPLDKEAFTRTNLSLPQPQCKSSVARPKLSNVHHED